MTIGQNIQRLRKDAKLSQTALARILVVTDRSVARWESDDRVPDVATLRRIAAALGTTISTLVSEE
jgi:transcriptional regulator with XRE-family HTH domain